MEDGTMGIVSKCVYVEDSYDKREFYYELTNDGNTDILLDQFVLFETDDLQDLGVDSAHCKMYRSGRHKNDMPSVFALGRMSEAMKDAMVDN